MGYFFFFKEGEGAEGFWTISLTGKISFQRADGSYQVRLHLANTNSFSLIKKKEK